MVQIYEYIYRPKEKGITQMHAEILYIIITISQISGVNMDLWINDLGSTNWVREFKSIPQFMYKLQIKRYKYKK